MDELNDNELGFITNTLGLETNPLFNDELNLNSISHDGYIKSEDDLFLGNDENWLSSLDNEGAFSHLSLNHATQNSSINHHNSVDPDSISSHHSRSVNPNDLQKSSILVKKKRKLDLFDHSNGLLSTDVEVSDLGSNQRLKSANVRIKTENQIEDKMSRVNLNSKAAKLLGKPIKSETSRQEEVRYIKKEKLDEEFDESDPENDDDDEEIDELLQFPVSSSILDDQCGSPNDLNQLNYLIHDSDSGSSHFDDGYQSSATSTNYTSSQLLSEGKRPLKGNNGTLLINGQSGTNHDQLLQVHNYSCIKQDKFLPSANKQLGNPHLVSNGGNQLVYLKHDGLLNGGSNYTSSNSSLSGGSNSSSPTQSPNARKSGAYARRLAKGDEQQRQNGLRSGNCSLKLQQTGGRGSRSKPITDLHLTDEERRLLNKEGYHDFPAGDHPILTKSEEKILRKIRRKIRNKRSAQCSRQRKKEYLEELEKKYSKSTNELQCLKSEVLKLRRQNVSLMSKLQKVMRFVGNQSINLNDDEDEQLSPSGSSASLAEPLPDQICGEHINLTNSTHQTQLDAADGALSVLGDSNGEPLASSSEDLSRDDDRTGGDPELASLDDDLLGLLPSNGELEFDFDSFELSDLREDLKDDDGLLSYVNRLNSSDSQFESQLLSTSGSPDYYHQQAPVKTSLFILVLCFVLMFVPFLRPDGLDNSLTYLENQIGQHSNELIASSNQLATIL